MFGTEKEGYSKDSRERMTVGGPKISITGYGPNFFEESAGEAAT